MAARDGRHRHDVGGPTLSRGSREPPRADEGENRHPHRHDHESAHLPGLLDGRAQHAGRLEQLPHRHAPDDPRREGAGPDRAPSPRSAGSGRREPASERQPAGQHGETIDCHPPDGIGVVVLDGRGEGEQGRHRGVGDPERSSQGALPGEAPPRGPRPRRQRPRQELPGRHEHRDLPVGEVDAGLVERPMAACPITYNWKELPRNA